MKETLFAFACMLVAAFSGAATAQDLNKLELGTHELSEMKTLSGVRLVFDPTKIMMAYALPRSSGRGFVTNIIGLAGGPQEIDEPADSLLERLNLKPFFVALTLPDGIPVWVKTSAISFLRSIEPWDHIRAEAKTAVSTGGPPIFVKESMAAIKDAINTMRRQNKDSGLTLP
jgi:hypothetical protein